MRWGGGVLSSKIALQHTYIPLRVRKYLFEERLFVLVARNLELLLDKARTVLVPAELHRVTFTREKKRGKKKTNETVRVKTKGRDRRTYVHANVAGYMRAPSFEGTHQPEVSTTTAVRGKQPAVLQRGDMNTKNGAFFFIYFLPSHLFPEFEGRLATPGILATTTAETH